MRNKMVEGMDLYFRDIFYMPETDDKCEYGAVLPNSIEYNSDYGKYSTMYSFYKGMGHKNMVESKYNTLYNETNKILDELIDMLEKKKSDCEGKFTRGKCSKECGLGYNKVTYKINSDIYDDSKCDYKNGETYYEECVLRDCEEGDECSVDNDCRHGRCINKKCAPLFKCDKDMFLDNCRTEKDCLNLNEKYKNGKLKYNWDGKKCSSSSNEEYTGEYDESKNYSNNVTGLDIEKTNKLSIGSPTTPPTKGTDCNTQFSNWCKYNGCDCSKHNNCLVCLGAGDTAGHFKDECATNENFINFCNTTTTIPVPTTAADASSGVCNISSSYSTFVNNAMVSMPTILNNTLRDQEERCDSYKSQSQCISNQVAGVTTCEWVPMACILKEDYSGASDNISSICNSQKDKVECDKFSQFCIWKRPPSSPSSPSSTTTPVDCDRCIDKLNEMEKLKKRGKDTKLSSKCSKLAASKDCDQCKNEVKFRNLCPDDVD